jgi:urea transport system substrate-binding protein
MAVSEKPLVDATLMAIAEINEKGGILGRRVQPIVEDCGSDSFLFKQKARRLTHKYRTSAVFGCWTSLSRKAVLPIFEASHSLLWYPVQYEGLEKSSHIFYTGLCLNQQIESAVTWLLEQGHRRFYLLGSDYVFPLTAHKLIKSQLKQAGAVVVGEDYTALGNLHFEEIVQNIQEAEPDIVFNTLNGLSNVAFYQAYQEAGITAAQLPIMAVSIAEEELQEIGAAAIDHYACWSYFQSLETPENQQFVTNFKQRYGSHRVTSDPIQTAYTQVYLWKQAVETAGCFEVDRMRSAAYGQTFLSPGGWVKLDENHHLWNNYKIGQVISGGQFKIVHENPELIKPLPWLGVEEQSFKNAGIVIELLSDLSQGVQYRWQLEKHSLTLEATMKQLQHEILQRQQAEKALQQTNQLLELRVQQRTLELQEKNDRLEQALEDLKQAQIHLIHTEKMSSLGQLVAGIAHEINNPINFIYGNVVHISGYAEDLMTLVSLYKAKYPNPDRAIEALSDSIDIEFLLEDLPKIVSSLRLGSDRIREIVLSLKTFSRLDEATVKAVSIHDGIDSTLTILRSRLKAKPTMPEIQVIRDYGNLPKVECYAGQLNQVFMNILANAIDALEERDLERTAQDLADRPSQITIQTCLMDDRPHVIIRISDNGPGIPEAIQNRLFDPFFTTKEVGKGTGLGLAISHQIIVERHGGILRCVSQSNQGTEFWIEIPLTQGTT